MIYEGTMGLFDNIKGAQIMKESNRAKEQLAAMEELLVSVTLPKLVLFPALQMLSNRKNRFLTRRPGVLNVEVSC